MLVTLSGRVMLFRELHFANIQLPILATPSGIVMLVRRLHCSNAELMINFVFSLMEQLSTEVSLAFISAK